MHEYTFYPMGADGVATTFECENLPSDADAMVHAEKVLDQHSSAQTVVIWQGEREVFTLPRRSPGSGSVGWPRGSVRRCGRKT